MIPLTPTLKAELVTIDDDIVRYRVYCDQCDGYIIGSFEWQKSNIAAKQSHFCSVKI
jgi:hypothetical protein